jgi:dienelactone hydrolase
MDRAANSPPISQDRKPRKASAVVVLQELFGVNADIRKHCDELAEQGYLAVAPDLYWRQEPGRFERHLRSWVSFEHLGIAPAPAWLFAAELREGMASKITKNKLCTKKIGDSIFGRRVLTRHSGRSSPHNAIKRLVFRDRHWQVNSLAIGSGGYSPALAFCEVMKP